jgi:hypothetical protein
MRKSTWALVIWSGLIVMWMSLVATVDCRTYTGSCGQAKAGNISFLALLWFVGLLVVLGVRFRTQIKASYHSRFSSTGGSFSAGEGFSAGVGFAAAPAAWQRPGLIESRAGRFSAMHNTRWVLPGNNSFHVLAISRGLFGRLGVSVDGRAVASLGRMGLGGVTRTSQPISVDGHQVVVFGQYLLRQGGLAGAFNLAAYYFDVFVDGRSLLDGSEIGVLAGRVGAAQSSPAALFYRRLWSPANIVPTITVGEAVALTREHAFLAGWVVLLVGNVLVLQAGARGWSWTARVRPGVRRWTKAFVVALCVVGLATVMLAAALAAQRL